jgi:thiamine-monophosphate kinase
MKVSELGEFGLIALLAGVARGAEDRKKDAWKRLIIGIGDDAAAWQAERSVQLATADSLIQDIHFKLEITSWEELGWRAMAANLSDIAAMGGIPRYALVSLALPGHTEVDDVVALYKGMAGLAEKFGVAIAGGDTSSAPLLVINITVLGSAGNKSLLTRSVAMQGEKIAVTGYLGAAAAGLEMLVKGLSFNAQATASLKEAFLKPNPRVAEGQLLVDGGVQVAIDISDGLISDLRHICQESQVGARVELDRVPVHPAVRANFGDRALELALTGGEDYELLFAASEEVLEKVKATVACPVTVIGEIVTAKEHEVTLFDGDGKQVSPAKSGWEHFAGGKADHGIDN